MQPMMVISPGDQLPDIALVIISRWAWRYRSELAPLPSVTDTAARHAPYRPELDEISAQAIGQPSSPLVQEPEPEAEPGDRDADAGHDNARTRDVEHEEDPEVILWAALSLAPGEGISVPDLVTTTGMGRRWIYYASTPSPARFIAEHSRRLCCGHDPKSGHGPARASRS